MRYTIVALASSGRIVAPMLTLAATLASPGIAVAQTDPLPSWNDGQTKQALIKFVGDTTRAGGPAFVPPAERIAVFDNDGTLWSEQPFYFQVAFALEQVKAQASKHPEWQTQEPFKSCSPATSRARWPRAIRPFSASLPPPIAG